MGNADWTELYASNRATIERALTRKPQSVDRGVGAPHTHFRRRAVPLPATPRPTEPGSWVERTFSTAGGPRRAMVYTPLSACATTAVPLLCMLHGCTQDPTSFAAATLMNATAERRGFVALYPQQERHENARGCWNWFLPEHQQRDRGEPAALAAIIREIMGPGSPQKIDEDRVYVAGLSAGGAMAAVVAATHPDLVSGLAVHSGLAYGAANNVARAFAAMAGGAKNVTRLGRVAHAAMGDHSRAIPTIVIHGSADTTVAPVNGEQAIEQWVTAGRLADPGSVVERSTQSSSSSAGQLDDLGHTVSRWTDDRGRLRHELLSVHGLGHAWSGGAAGGSFTDPRGPSATEAIWRFFAESANHSVTPDR